MCSVEAEVQIVPCQQNKPSEQHYMSVWSSDSASCQPSLHIHHGASLLHSFIEQGISSGRCRYFSLYDFSEVTGLIPSTHMAVHTIYNSSPSSGLHRHLAQVDRVHIHAGKTIHTHERRKSSLVHTNSELYMERTNVVQTQIT